MCVKDKLHDSIFFFTQKAFLLHLVFGFDQF